MNFDIPCLPGEKVYILDDLTERVKNKTVVKTIVKCGIVDHITIGQALSPIITVCDDENTWTDYDIQNNLGVYLFLSLEEAENHSNLVNSFLLPK